MKFSRTEAYDDAINAGLIKAAILDSPVHGQLLHQPTITLAGWVLSSDENALPIELIVETDGASQHYTLNVERPDVISRVLNKESDARLRCGFKVSIQTCQKARIFTVINGKRFLRWEVVLDEEDRETTLERHNALLDGLKKPTGLDQGRRQRVRDLAKPLTASDLSLMLSAEVNVISADKFAGAVSSEQRPFIRRFFETLQDSTSLAEWVQSASRVGYIVVPDAFADGVASCSFSFFTDSRINLLFFDSPTEPFIVFQHVTYVDAVFFPQRNVVIIFQHLTIESILKSAADAIFWLIAQDADSTPTLRTFGGGISGFGRPYHFFYDVVPALKCLHEKGLMTGLPQIFCTSGSFFAHPSDLFDGAPQLITAEPKDLRQRVLDRGEFHCHIGLPFLRIPNDLNHRVDDFLREAALRKHPQPKRANSAQSLRLWCGITGQKRSWVEQVEGTAHILDQLAGEYPQLEVIFDGWTCPIDPGPGDDREIAKDEAVVADILSRMHTKVTTQSVIGKTSLEKIAIGMTCDAFVANYSTGSMHISRFADRPGVLHINTLLLKDEHIQHRAVTVPASRTRDVPDDIDKRADFVSYSIDPDDILLLLRGVIETRNR